MLVTKHFILLHVQKTGGTFIRQLCEEHLPPDWLVDPSTVEWKRPYFWHLGYEAIPEEFSELPVVSFVRNPWDWYVSWYEHLVTNPPGRDGGLLWTRVLDRGQASFDRMVRVSCTAETEEGPVAAPRGPGPRWLQIMRRRNVDYYTALLELMIGADAGGGRIQVVKFEDLREGFLGFLEANGIAVPAVLESAIRSEAPRNVSARGGYREYYDEPLRDLVAARAAEVIERFGYSF